MRKVLVTGATGFIGYEVSHQLSSMGLRPRLLVRRPERGALLAPLDAELVQGDLTSVKSLIRAVQGVDTVIHLAARATFESYEVVRPTIVDGSVALMKAARDAGVEAFIYTSSILVYGNQRNPIDLNTPTFPMLGYGKAKLEAEEALSKIATEAGMHFAAIRLPHVYGTQDLLFEKVRRGYVFFPGSGENHFAHIHVEDAARVLIAVAEKGWSGVSPVADDYSASWNEFFTVIQEYYPRFRQIKLPRWIAYIGAWCLEKILRIRSIPSISTTGTITGFNLNLEVKPRLLWNDLGMTPKYPTIHQGIPSVLDGFVAFRWRHPISDHAG